MPIMLYADFLTKPVNNNTIMDLLCIINVTLFPKFFVLNNESYIMQSDISHRIKTIGLMYAYLPTKSGRFRRRGAGPVVGSMDDRGGYKCWF